MRSLGKYTSAHTVGLLLFLVWISLVAHGASPEVVTFGGSPYYPPFHFMDDDHRVDGFDVDMFRAVARETGWETDYRFGDWEQIQEDLAGGEVDLVPMFVSAERQARYLFSDPINIEYHLLFGRAEMGSHRGVETLEGHRVAMEGGAYVMQELAKLDLDIVLVGAQSEAEALRMVVRGDADMAFLPSGIARYTIADENLRSLVALSPPLLPVSYAFAVNPQRPELLDPLNQAILKLQREGAIDAIRAEWLGGESPSLTVALGYMNSVALPLALTVAVTIVGFVVYRSRLRRIAVATIHAQARGLSLPEHDFSMKSVSKNLQLMSDLKTALQAGGVSWVYQPQFCVRTKRIIGAEMLIRWQHPERGWVPPDQFIVQAEESGLIKDVTREVFKQAIKTLQGWRDLEQSFRLSINVSANDLNDRRVVEEMIDQLGEFAKFLTLEITETAILQDSNSIISNVELLKRAGVMLSLDDYGTGYSSLKYLKEFNFDEIKIDKTFIQELARSERNLKLTDACISLGHSLGAVVVAEGVEDEQTAELLRAHGCDVLQGFGISRPLPLDEFRKFAEAVQTGTQER